MTEKIVHNSSSDARVFDSRGRIVGPHQNVVGDDADPVTARLVGAQHIEPVRRRDKEGEKPPIPVPPVEEQEELGRPALNASRDRWAGYAEQLGYSSEELEALTRTEIIELVDSGAEAAESDSESPEEDSPSEYTAEGEGGAESAAESSEDDSQAVRLAGGAENDKATAHGGAETDTNKETE